MTAPEYTSFSPLPIKSASDFPVYVPTELAAQLVQEGLISGYNDLDGDNRIAKGDTVTLNNGNTVIVEEQDLENEANAENFLAQLTGGKVGVDIISTDRPKLAATYDEDKFQAGIPQDNPVVVPMAFLALSVNGEPHTLSRIIAGDGSGKEFPFTEAKQIVETYMNAKLDWDDHREKTLDVCKGIWSAKKRGQCISAVDERFSAIQETQRDVDWKYGMAPPPSFDGPGEPTRPEALQTYMRDLETQFADPNQGITFEAFTKLVDDTGELKDPLLAWGQAYKEFVGFSKEDLKGKKGQEKE